MTAQIKATIGIGAIVGLALFFGDGMLTPPSPCCRRWKA
jgi:K+ transporter